MESFGTDKYPIHCSSIWRIMRCPLQAVLLAQGVMEAESAEAADTGSITHAAIAAYHRKEDIAAALRKAAAQFPLGDIDDAKSMVEPYCADPANQSAELLAVETTLQATIPPDETDPTQAPIVLMGTCDQIRRQPDGRLEVWDVKTSKRHRRAILYDTIWQLVGYSYIATRTLGVQVLPGGVIYVRGYSQKTYDYGRADGAVFLPVALTYDMVQTMIASLAQTVARIRAGSYIASPGEHCQFCPSTPMSCLSLSRKTDDKLAPVKNVDKELLDSASRVASVLPAVFQR